MEDYNLSKEHSLLLFKHVKKVLKVLFCLHKNAKEAAIVDNLEVYGVENIKEVIDFFNGERELVRTIVDTRKEF